jgi:hypothetical protein
VAHPPGSIQPDGLFDGIQWSAVAYGALVDILVTFAANLPLVALFAPEALTADPAEAERVMREAASSPDFLLAGLLVGAAATAFGAWVGARRAGVHHLRHGGWVAIASLLLGFLPLLVFEAGPAPPLWYQAAGILLMLPAGLLGGYLAQPRDEI